MQGPSHGERSLVRRALVVTDESARHPYRASLPPFVKAQAITLRTPLADLANRLPVQAIKEFLLAYCACFLAVSTFIF